MKSFLWRTFLFNYCSFVGATQNTTSRFARAQTQVGGALSACEIIFSNLTIPHFRYVTDLLIVKMNIFVSIKWNSSTICFNEEMNLLSCFYLQYVTVTLVFFLIQVAIVIVVYVDKSAVSHIMHLYVWCSVVCFTPLILWEIKWLWGHTCVCWFL